jgi:hypothetical protein
MAVINIMNIKPTTISRSIRDKFLLLYGLPKVGKTSWAANIPNNLFCATEVGYHGINGITAVDIQSWSDWKLVLMQLERPEALEHYKTVTIDTISILYDLCVKYICDQNNVDTIGDIPYGKGYALVSQEFASSLRKVTQMGLGLIMLAHANIQYVALDGDEDKVVEQVSPKIDKRPFDIVNQLADIIAYIKMDFDKDNNVTRTLITRRTPYIVAGSRFKYLAPEIPFGYDELVNALLEAIDLQGKNDGAKIVDETEHHSIVTNRRPFSETIAEAQILWQKLVSDSPENAEIILSKVKTLFGKEMRLSEIPESQQDLFEILIEDLKKM